MIDLITLIIFVKDKIYESPLYITFQCNWFSLRLKYSSQEQQCEIFYIEFARIFIADGLAQAV
jgi:hypothetical protein